MKAKRTLSFRRVDKSAGCKVTLEDWATKQDAEAIQKLYADDPDFEETTRGEITCVCGEPLGCDCTKEIER